MNFKIYLHAYIPDRYIHTIYLYVELHSFRGLFNVQKFAQHIEHISTTNIKFVHLAVHAIHLILLYEQIKIWCGPHTTFSYLTLQ